MEITPTALAEKAGISIPYASQLINRVRRPGYKHALVLWRKTGIKFGDLDCLDDEMVARLDQIERERAA